MEGLREMKGLEGLNEMLEVAARVERRCNIHCD